MARLLLALVALLTWPCALAMAADTFLATVSKVSDGDTIAVQVDGEKVRVRLYGIDCPESKQPYGREATKALKRLIRVGDTVEVRQRDRDRYGRVVAWVFAGGTNVNEAMVKAGAAWMYVKYCKERGPCATLDRLEREAREARRGLWADPAAVAPWEWRHNQR